ncbi:rCG32074 [Rattus norvegicus]|uniref:RCG32074 n=1 Tax=Rattus norvegicus TaxID=10116 RepID=A6JX06_RAT|nr:rCG32074 [Rattus norvegicus]
MSPLFCLHCQDDHRPLNPCFKVFAPTESRARRGRNVFIDTLSLDRR